MRAIQRLIDNLASDEVILYLDEVDIHLNPKIGPVWTPAGKQKYVRTPGCNEKRYLAGALNPKTGNLTWIEGDRKNSLLFLDLLYKFVTKTYRSARRIHFILDNYGWAGPSCPESPRSSVGSMCSPADDWATSPTSAARRRVTG